MEHPLKNITKVYNALCFFEEVEKAEMKEKHLYLIIDGYKFSFRLDMSDDLIWTLLITVHDEELTTLIAGTSLNSLVNNGLVDAVKELLANIKKPTEEYFHWVIDIESYPSKHPRFLEVYDQYWGLVTYEQAIEEEIVYTKEEYKNFLKNGVLDIFRPVNPSLENDN